MADLFLYNEDDPDNDEAEGYGDVRTNPDDLLPPISKLEKYVDSENLFNRQMVARTLLDTLRTVVDDPEDIEAVLGVMNKLADDQDPSVRAELMEQVPHIAMFCQEFKSRLSDVVPQYLLPMVVKFLTDAHNQARKTSQAALLVLLEQGLVDKEDVQEQVCPVIIRLTECNSSDEYRTEAVALLSKMAPLIGKEMAESLFLERFASLCVDPLFHVRKVCAANFGDFSSVVGSESTELVLLPKFFYLCEDGVWGVRKACADVFMPVSCVCSASVRQTELAPIFINLLKDQSRWVRMAAFQALGPFISTFADATITALLHNDNGEIVISDTEKLALRLDELEQQRERDRQEKTAVSPESLVSKPSPEQPVIVTPDSTSEGAQKGVSSSQEDYSVVSMDLSEEDIGKETASQLQAFSSIGIDEARAKAYIDSQESNGKQTASSEYNTFNYWRDPILPVVLEDGSSAEPERCLGEYEDEEEDVNFTPQSTSSPAIPRGNAEANILDEDAGSRESSSSQDNNSTQDICSLNPLWATFNVSSSTNNTTNDPALPQGPPHTEQSIVPQLLIDHYVSMTDPSRAQTVDNEIARHCAFSLPAVALTLGRSNWPLLRDTYEALATDMQWKVRRTLASSIHELGVILGQEAASKDLIPIFDGFLKDLDEVRIGLLKHLADFLKLLSTDDRREYLPKLSEFLKMDNERNWRFRLELTEQLEKMISLYTPEEIEEHMTPIAMVLVRDKVADVRKCAIDVVAGIVKALEEADRPALSRTLLGCSVDSLAKGSLWVHRQTYAALALKIFDVEAFTNAEFAEDVLPSLLDLSEDKVPNVRLAVARSLSHISKQTDYFRTERVDQDLQSRSLPSLSIRVLEVEENLKNDCDVDVRSFFGGNHRRSFHSGSAMTELEVDAEEEEEEQQRLALSNKEREE